MTLYKPTRRRPRSERDRALIDSQRPLTKERGKHTYPLRFLLSSWYIERGGAGWYVRSYRNHRDNTAPWRGPYRSIESACLIIARALMAETHRRYARSTAFYVDKLHRDLGLDE